MKTVEIASPSFGIFEPNPAPKTIGFGLFADLIDIVTNEAK